MDVEPGEAIHALKLLKAVERHLTSARDELQQLSALLLVVTAHGAPEPLDLWRGGRVVVIFGVGFPVIDINLGQTRDEKLKLLLVEDRD